MKRELARLLKPTLLVVDELGYTAYKHKLRFPQVDSAKGFLTLCI
jgi:hypothetical protein